MRLVAVSLLVLVGCGDNQPQAPDASHPRPDGVGGDFVTAPHTPLPLVVAHADHVLDHPKLITIVYGDYPAKAMVKAWGDAVATSSWWPTVGAEYGIGTMTHAATFELPNAPTTTTQDTDLEATIQGLIQAGSVPAPPASGNEYLYMIYVPSTVPLGDSLQGFFGYHAMLTRPGGAKFPYAVVLDDGTGIDTTTTTASHELIEAATDPYDPPNDGWYTDPALPDPWNLILGEVGDLCGFEPLEEEGGFAYQRIWSNAAAIASGNPCIPSHGDAWNTVTASPATMPTVAKGSAPTFTLTGWSTQQIADWAIDTDVADYSDLSYSQMNPTLSATTINNGTSVTLTLHVPANATSGSSSGVYILSGDYDRPWAVGFTVQ